MTINDLARILAVRGRTFTPASQPPPSGTITTLRPEDDLRRIIGHVLYWSHPIPDPAFEVYGVVRTKLGRSGETAALTGGRYYGIDYALDRLQLSRGARLIARSHGHHDWCKGWPVAIVATQQGAFAVVIDLREKRIRSYPVQATPVRAVTVSETVTRRRTIWR